MNSSEEQRMAIDCGTQSVRAVLIDLSGSILQVAKTVIEPYLSVNPDLTEQYPEYFRNMTFESMKNSFAKQNSGKRE